MVTFELSWLLLRLSDSRMFKDGTQDLAHHASDFMVKLQLWASKKGRKNRMGVSQRPMRLQHQIITQFQQSYNKASYPGLLCIKSHVCSVLDCYTFCELTLKAEAGHVNSIDTLTVHMVKHVPDKTKFEVEKVWVGADIFHYQSITATLSILPTIFSNTFSLFATSMVIQYSLL